MSSWDRASSAFDSFGTMLEDWHGATRGSLGETNFDIYGNIQHDNRMKNDTDYANAFNQLNSPNYVGSKIDPGVQDLMLAYDLKATPEYLRRKEEERMEAQAMDDLDSLAGMYDDAPDANIGGRKRHWSRDTSRHWFNNSWINLDD